MYRRLDDMTSVAGQLLPEQLQAIADAGYRTVINNRPDGEEAGQPTTEEMARAAKAADLSYHAIPMGQAGMTDAMIDHMTTVLRKADGPVLAFCRSGTRSTLLWAVARARLGDEPASLFAKAGGAGYDLTPVRSLLTKV
ncbi:TIGR01244 family sulfur transferase [Sphingomonas montana]|uniref:TIGR01244 family sulfur transferase n=1 Tax=Sphingomonas montana TaxID=1843236 RepID=UPI00096F681D|nr:TIGR01244 family sulfur transferase [Sphingomonas montana]